MFTRILVPLDGSRRAEWALPMAASIARRTGGRLLLIGVTPPLAHVGAAMAMAEGPFSEMYRQRIETEMQSYLEHSRESVAQATGLPVAARLRNGRVVDSILDEARQTDAGLIVMTSHGRGPVSRAWLGSVTDALIRRASVPVLVQRTLEDEAPDLDADHAFDPIVVALDGSEEAEQSLTAAAALARSFGVGLSVLRVLEPPYTIGSPYLPHTVSMNVEALSSRRLVANEYLASVARRMEAPDLPVRPHLVVASDVPRAITRTVAEQPNGLLVLTTHARHGVGRMLLGSVADKVLRTAGGPVLTLRRVEAGVAERPAAAAMPLIIGPIG